MADGVVDLLVELLVDHRDQFADVILQRPRGEVLLAEIAGKNQFANELDELDDRITIGKVSGINVASERLGLITGDDRLHQRIEIDYVV